MEGVKVHRIGPRDVAWFFKKEREEVYPFLSPEQLSAWEKEGFPIRFVLEQNGVLIGGIIFEVYEFLDKENVVLDLDAFFISREFQQQDLDKHLLLEGLRMAKEYYQLYQWRVVGLLIKTTDAAGFYEKVLYEGGYKFKKMEARYPTNGVKTITFFYVSIPS